jgi:hypothetical protein
MKLRMIAATALMTLAACGQAGESAKQETTTAAAPAGVFEHLERTAPEMQPVTAWQQLMTHAETMPACRDVRRTESKGIVPANVAPDSAYAGHAGEWVFSIQCGPQLTTVRPDPHEHWLIFFAPGAATSTIANCAQGAGDRCLLAQIPTASAATTTTTTP